MIEEQQIPQPYTQEFLEYIGKDRIAQLSTDPVLLKVFAYWYGEWSQGADHAGWTEEELRAKALGDTWSEAAAVFRGLGRDLDADIASTVAFARYYFWEDPAFISALRKLNNYFKTHNTDGTPVEK